MILANFFGKSAADVIFEPIEVSLRREIFLIVLLARKFQKRANSTPFDRKAEKLLQRKVYFRTNDL